MRKTTAIAAIGLAFALLTVAVQGAGATTNDAPEDPNVCYIWIDGNFYCCEQHGQYIKCEAPPRALEAGSVEGVASLPDAAQASNGCIGDKDTVAVCVCTQTFQPLYEVWVNGKQVAEGPICI